MLLWWERPGWRTVCRCYSQSLPSYAVRLLSIPWREEPTIAAKAGNRAGTPNQRKVGIITTLIQFGSRNCLFLNQLGLRTGFVHQRGIFWTKRYSEAKVLLKGGRKLSNNYPLPSSAVRLLGIPRREQSTRYRRLDNQEQAWFLHWCWGFFWVLCQNRILESKAGISYT